jgi:hypothetical protein
MRVIEAVEFSDRAYDLIPARLGDRLQDRR